MKTAGKADRIMRVSPSLSITNTRKIPPKTFTGLIKQQHQGRGEGAAIRALCVASVRSGRL